MASGNTFSDVRFLTVAEVAEVMRVSKMTVYRLVHSGELPAVRFGRSFRVPENAVAEHLSHLSPRDRRESSSSDRQAGTA
ncbi:helix-turn-helix domain-containing protein [Psychromicrobium xiongbiense]|uniref:helix-turn-helix domain-containing protein n=1 Tax=Psychromicrobium xiongbiense TaxID=3051184 RepID=UPI002556BAA1|nr:helix-turn-helix domain-containing protein [Psychromicrobium sp. YIM S02556]